MKILEYDIKTAYDDAHLTVYLHNETCNFLHDRFKRDMLLISPGGGYFNVVYWEGEPVALKFFDLGLNTAVLTYSVAPHVFPEALVQMAAALAFIRDHAEEYNVDENRIFIGGFSAGGHLAASLGTLWNKPEIVKAIGMDTAKYKPNGMILGYPVITSGEFAHHDSIKNLLGEKYGDERLMELVSLEKQVDGDTVPTFIWTTVTDDCVPSENSILFINALKRNNILFECMLFAEGRHGLSVCTMDALPTIYNEADCRPNLAVWIDRAKEFIDKV